jgi:hypothetical protein
MDDRGTLTLVQFFQMRRVHAVPPYHPQIQRQSFNTLPLLVVASPSDPERLSQKSD